MIRMVTRKGGQKMNNGTKQSENEQVQICLTRRFEEQKNQARKKSKQTSRKAVTRQNKKEAVK